VRAGGADLVHAHWVMPNALAAAPAVGRTPLAIGLHGSDVFLAERRGVRWAIGRALRRSSLLTSCSPELARRVEALGAEPGRTRVIPYGVDVGLFRPDPARRALWRDRLAIPAHATVALSVGRMATKKGYPVLLDGLDELLERVPELHLVLAGGGDRLEEWQRATERHRGRVHLPGAVQHDVLPDLYRAADLFVLPAIHDRRGNVDGLPNVILEAMASGLPVVASAISGIPLAVEDGRTGRLVPEGDSAALVAALVELAAAPSVRGAWGEAARSEAERELTWDVVAGRYRDGYRAALAAPITRS
jgi:glycosyltransferase involved in cell wall biosynthesis